MGSDIIVEGSKDSIPMHNLVYSKLIGDGDNSVAKKLNLVKPYGLNFTTSRIDCTNHILGNYVNRLRDMAAKRKNNRVQLLSCERVRQCRYVVQPPPPPQPPHERARLIRR